MKPTIKEKDDLHAMILSAIEERKLTYADIAKLSDVDQSQVGRICKGDFKTFSHNVVQVCNVLDVKVPQIDVRPDTLDGEWAKARSSMIRIWDHTPEGAKSIRRVLEAIADLQTVGVHGGTARSDQDQP